MTTASHGPASALCCFGSNPSFTLIGSVQADTQQEVITVSDGLEPHDGIHYFAEQFRHFKFQ